MQSLFGFHGLAMPQSTGSVLPGEVVPPGAAKHSPPGHNDAAWNNLALAKRLAWTGGLHDLVLPTPALPLGGVLVSNGQGAAPVPPHHLDMTQANPAALASAAVLQQHPAAAAAPGAGGNLLLANGVVLANHPELAGALPFHQLTPGGAAGAAIGVSGSAAAQTLEALRINSQARKQAKREANRRSAQLCRERKKQFIEELTTQNLKLRRHEEVLSVLTDMVCLFEIEPPSGAARDGVATLSTDRIAYMSRAVNTSLQFTEDELLGKSFLELLSFDSRKLLKRLLVEKLHEFADLFAMPPADPVGAANANGAPNAGAAPKASPRRASTTDRPPDNSGGNNSNGGNSSSGGEGSPTNEETSTGELINADLCRAMAVAMMRKDGCVVSGRLNAVVSMRPDKVEVVCSVRRCAANNSHQWPGRAASSSVCRSSAAGAFDRGEAEDSASSGSALSDEGVPPRPRQAPPATQAHSSGSSSFSNSSFRSDSSFASNASSTNSLPPHGQTAVTRPDGGGGGRPAVGPSSTVGAAAVRASTARADGRNQGSARIRVHPRNDSGDSSGSGSGSGKSEEGGNLGDISNEDDLESSSGSDQDRERCWQPGDHTHQSKRARATDE